MKRWPVVLVFVTLVVAATAAPAQERWAEKMFLKEGTKEIDISHDFGSVPHGADLFYRFAITNIYAVPLDIGELQPSCGCVTAKATVTTLQPKEKAYIEVNMNTTRFLGLKSVMVRVPIEGANQFRSTAELKVMATIRQDVVFNPGQASFGVVTQGEAPTREVEVEYAGALAATWQLTEVVASGSPVQATFKEAYRNLPDKPNRVGFVVRVTLNKDVPAGVLKQAIFLKTNDAASPLVPLFVEASVQAALEAFPSKLNLVSLKAGSEIIKPVVLRGAKPFRVLSVEGTGKDVSLGKDLSKDAARVQTVFIKCQPGEAGDFKREVKIKTDLQDAPVTVVIEGKIQ